MVVVILADAHLSVGGDVQQAFHRFEVFGRDAFQDVARLPEKQQPDTREIYGQNAGQQAHVPQRQSSPHAAGSGRVHGASSRSTNPTPRTVCRSFFLNGSSNFFRKCAMWTSITLSSGV